MLGMRTYTGKISGKTGIAIHAVEQVRNLAKSAQVLYSNRVSFLPLDKPKSS